MKNGELELPLLDGASCNFLSSDYRRPQVQAFDQRRWQELLFSVGMSEWISPIALID
jgi:hypothetical protein